MLESKEYLKALGSLSKYIPEFESLCARYGLSSKQRYVDKDGEERGQYILLLDMYTRRRAGIYPTNEEVQADYSALDIARMLKQLSLYSGGYFTLQVMSDVQDYRNPDIGTILIKSLTEALSRRVEKIPSLNSSNPNNPLKGKPVMLLSKGFGSIGRASIIPYPKGVEPQQDGFSEAELTAIIDYENMAKEEWEKSQGNTERWENIGRSRLPELGRMAQEIKDLLPLGWREVDKNNFVADYMRGAGFLDFKKEVWLGVFDKKSRQQKDRMVRNWLQAYGGVK